MLQLPRPPPSTSPTAGHSYIFFKFHKVGGSTLANAMQYSWSEWMNNSDSVCPHEAPNVMINATVKDVWRYNERCKRCSLCNTHESLALLPRFRKPSTLAAPPAKRLAALFGDPPACCLMGALGNTLHTFSLIRRPIDRVVSKYFFERTYCGKQAAQTGKTSCAALELDLLRWLYASQKTL